MQNECQTEIQLKLIINKYKSKFVAQLLAEAGSRCPGTTRETTSTPIVGGHLDLARIVQRRRIDLDFKSKKG